MTTKQWLLDLIDGNKEHLLDCWRKCEQGTQERVEFHNAMAMVDAARRLVEPCPDEPGKL
jgi:hypothetical protein